MGWGVPACHCGAWRNCSFNDAGNRAVACGWRLPAVYLAPSSTCALLRCARRATGTPHAKTPARDRSWRTSGSWRTHRAVGGRFLLMRLWTMLHRACGTARATYARRNAVSVLTLLPRFSTNSAPYNAFPHRSAHPTVPTSPDVDNASVASAGRTASPPAC